MRVTHLAVCVCVCYCGRSHRHEALLRELDTRLGGLENRKKYSQADMEVRSLPVLVHERLYLLRELYTRLGGLKNRRTWRYVLSRTVVAQSTGHRRKYSQADMEVRSLPVLDMIARTSLNESASHRLPL
jgi:hypothetical protein